MSLSVFPATGPELARAIPDLARLRIRVFEAYPYLYRGTIEYETEYLKTYSASPRSVVVLATDAGRVVGASTGLPLADETPNVQEPFREQAEPIEKIFYFGESVLDPAYRGRGIGVEFFKLREAHLSKLGGFEWSCFCAVDRPDDHPRRPIDYVPLDEFWKKRGYAKCEHLRASMSWQDLDEDQESAKTMIFWRKRWPHSFSV